MKETPLTPLHRRLGAGLSNEAGWNMPQQYTDLIEEHMATRSACGIFDISHVGKFRLTGNGALEQLEQLLSNRISDCCDGHTQQTLLLTDKGMIMDRITLCRESAGRFFLIGSASQADADFDSLQRSIRHGSLKLENETDRLCAIALLGPDADKVLSKVHFAAELPQRGEFCSFRRGGQQCLLTRAGLVSDESLELFCPAATGIAWFEQLMTAGAIPCGSRLREFLRLERGRADVEKDAEALGAESAGWGNLCANDKKYTGAGMHPENDNSCLVSLHSGSPGHKFAPGDAVHDSDGHHIGNITSSCNSPANGHGYAIAYVKTEHSAPGTHLWVQSGGNAVPAQVR